MEVAVVMAIITLFSIFFVPAVFKQMQSAKVEAAIKQANNILQNCEMARRKVISSTFDVRLNVTHTYASIPNWAGTAVIEGQVGGGLTLPRNNAFGNPILVKNDSHRCYVAVDLGFLLNGDAGYETETIGSSTRIIVSARPSLGASVDWVIQQKKMLSNETTR